MNHKIPGLLIVNGSPGILPLKLKFIFVGEDSYADPDSR